MYLFSFNKYAGHDRVFLYEKEIKTDAGDLIKIQDEYFFCLGDEISFQELYNYKLNVTWESELIVKKLLSEKTVELVHWMVYERYSTYKSVLKLFLSFDINKLLDNKLENAKNNVKQELFILPDLWTLYNTFDAEILEDKNTALVSSTQTQLQKNKLFWKIKTWKVNKIIWTSSEIFQDYKNLTKITFYSPHKRYYTSQQDPRYKTSMVVDKMKEIYGCELEIIE